MYYCYYFATSCRLLVGLMDFSVGFIFEGTASLHSCFGHLYSKLGILKVSTPAAVGPSHFPWVSFTFAIQIHRITGSFYMHVFIL